MSSDPTDTLDRSIRDSLGNSLTPGDVIVSWVAVAGVRHVHGGGYVITLCSDDQPPTWQVRGMLADAEADINRFQMINDMDGSDEE